MDSRRVPGPGINIVQVNQAREAFARTVRARDPRLSSQSSAQLTTDSNAFPDTTTAMSSPGAIKGRHRCGNPNNPACPHCSAVIIPAPRASLPLEDTPSISVEDWVVSTRKKPILNSRELEEWEQVLGPLTLPEMIFGNSFVRVENAKHGWCLEFNALDALKSVKLEDSGIRVSYANKWIDSKKKQQRHSDLDDRSLEIGQHYDWTYTTHYKGTLKASNPIHTLTRDDAEVLPLDKLARPDPILFYDEMVLIEDELADNGISVVSVKVRVMNERALILCRFFLRVDGVLFRVYDTRVYVEFDENKVVREYKKYEGDYKSVLSKQNAGHSRDPKAILRDSNWVVQHLSLVKRECDVIQF
ncbi:LAME_0H01706g1_1 [Lachancea meyersii CBS 8951]|uniref:LAME_0H01706g1_1 n=1 Tax=Lachancea meyersii CBS 8951 TaxID=1266667 RepID=A0A1G4KDA9_9SACH|nr:LAME_0H01706g1_1 [Lachancea meyersii CBS 8951]